MFFVKTPFWLKKVFRHYIWSVKTEEKVIYLTFDDGPHPQATPFILDQLKQFNAKASFFCIGKNVVLYPDIYQRIIEQGHTVGNHTQNHLNGWKTDSDTYLANAATAAQYISSTLFRPPYGRIKKRQGRLLMQSGYRIVMWDVLSGDFDRNLAKEKCKQHVIDKAGSGSIVVFHDSEKAFQNMSYSLPQVLAHFSREGYVFRGLQDGNLSK